MARKKRKNGGGAPRWALLFDDRSGPCLTSRRVLEGAGFHVTTIPVVNLAEPEVRINGNVYRGVDEIRHLAKRNSCRA
jgi:hypothetical protein